MDDDGRLGTFAAVAGKTPARGGAPGAKKSPNDAAAGGSGKGTGKLTPNLKLGGLHPLRGQGLMQDDAASGITAVSGSATTQLNLSKLMEYVYHIVCAPCACKEKNIHPCIHQHRHSKRFDMLYEGMHTHPDGTVETIDLMEPLLLRTIYYVKQFQILKALTPPPGTDREDLDPAVEVRLRETEAELERAKREYAQVYSRIVLRFGASLEGTQKEDRLFFQVLLQYVNFLVSVLFKPEHLPDIEDEIQRLMHTNSLAPHTSKRHDDKWLTLEQIYKLKYEGDPAVNRRKLAAYYGKPSSVQRFLQARSPLISVLLPSPREKAHKVSSPRGGPGSPRRKGGRIIEEEPSDEEEDDFQMYRLRTPEPLEVTLHDLPGSVFEPKVIDAATKARGGAVGQKKRSTSKKTTAPVKMNDSARSISSMFGEKKPDLDGHIRAGATWHGFRQYLRGVPPGSQVVPSKKDKQDQPEMSLSAKLDAAVQRSRLESAVKRGVLTKNDSVVARNLKKDHSRPRVASVEPQN